MLMKLGGRLSETNLIIAKAVDEIADEIKATSAQVALAWIKSKGYNFIPIVGARKVHQIEDSIGACHLELSQTHIEKLNQVSEIELGFPTKFLKSDAVLDLVRGEMRHRIDGRKARF